ncbi:MAG TPA: hypothetical protein VNO87_12285 [Methylomirabilota bacterium]|nr:hypothetical protein [Methylomirabilota bacterium]
MVGIRSRWTRKRLAVLAVFVGVAAYVFVAIWMQPVALGSNATFTGIPGHNPTKEAAVGGLGLTQQELVWPYVDGGVVTLVTSLANRGPVGLTITGVGTDPPCPRWCGLYSIKTTRAAVLANPGRCCELNESATWSARDFRPIYVDPGHEGVVALHILMTNCEYNGQQISGLARINVAYSVLGFQHWQKVDVGEYLIKTPDTCPRSGPARPAG